MVNKIIILVTVLILCRGVSAGNDFTVILRERGKTSKPVNPKLAVLANHSFDSSNFSWSFYGENNEGWGQGYTGLNWSPRKWLSLTVYAGMETEKGWWRLAADAWMGYKKLSCYVLGEYGASGYIIVAKPKIELFNFLSVGAMIRYLDRNWENGPDIELNIPRFKLSLEFAPEYATENKKIIWDFSLKRNF